MFFLQGNFFLLIPVLLPVIAGIASKRITERTTRNIMNMAVLIATAALTILTAVLPALGNEFTLLKLTRDLPILLRVDNVARLFSVLIAVMWAVVGCFSFEYMKHEHDEGRFYCFYMISLGALLGLAMSANLVTMYMFYEMMTLGSLPLVLHEKTKQSIAAGVKYLLYSVFGASCGLMGIFVIGVYHPTLDFVAGGFQGMTAPVIDGISRPALAQYDLNMALIAENKPLLLIILFVMILGFGVKAGMFPFHGWLPTAHPVAPAPASAVLSGVITKAGVLCIIRVVFYTFGADFIRGTWAHYAWMVLALITVFMGSMLALRENVLKKRLAYSTVSQVSYILFGLSTLTPLGMLGALMHVVFHSVIKNGLFLSAGAIINRTGKTRVDELNGIGKQMPVVMWCYTLVSCALIGIPPTCGFISKWFLAEGALSMSIAANWVGPCVLLVSAVLTAGYLLPITIRGFFPGADFNYGTLVKAEPNWLMTLPLIILAAAAVLLGMFPDALSSFLQTIIDAVL